MGKNQFSTDIVDKDSSKMLCFTSMRTYAFFTVYVLITLLSGLLFKLAWVYSPDSFLFSFIEFALPQLEESFHQDSGYKVYLVLSVISIVVFGCVDVLLTPRRYAKKLKTHLPTLGFVAFSLSNAPLSFTCYTVLPFVLVCLLNLLGIISLLLVGRRGCASILCFANAAFLLWGNLLSGIEVPCTTYIVIAIILVLSGIITIIGKCKC